MARRRKAEVVELPRKAGHPTADRLRAIADQIETGGIDSWVVISVAPSGTVTGEAHLGMHNLVALGFLDAYRHRVATASAEALFEAPAAARVPSGRIPRAS